MKVSFTILKPQQLQFIGISLHSGHSVQYLWLSVKLVTAIWNREAISMYAGSSSFLISSVNVLFKMVIVPFTKRIPEIVAGSSEERENSQAKLQYVVNKFSISTRFILSPIVRWIY